MTGSALKGSRAGLLHSRKDRDLNPSITVEALDSVLAELERVEKTAEFSQDVGKWFEYMCGGTLWSKQAEIANAIQTNKNVAIKAGHGVGKSFLTAVLICHWVDVHYPNCFVATTAPSVSQIGAIIWREVRRMYALIEKRYNEGIIDHKLPGKINQDNKNNEWKSPDGQLIGFGRKPPENKEDDSFQGIHDGYVLAIADEAVGVSGELIDALGNITSNEDSRRLLICNPTNPASYIGKLFREKNEAWYLDTISVFDSPNFTDERFQLDKEVLKKLTGPQYVEDKKKEYGENSARYKSRVLGEFAFDVGNALIQPEDIAKAIDTEILPTTQPAVMGVDVASYGEDHSVAYMNQGGRLRFLEAWDQSNAMQTANRIHRLAMDNGIRQVRIDAGGFGGAIVDLVRNLAYEEENATYTIVAMYGQAASPDKRRWINTRAFWWDKFRLLCREGELDMDPGCPKSETLQDELMSVEYKIANSGGLQIESKEEMRRRGFKSPDYADAAIYAMADLSWLDNDPLAHLKNGEELALNLDQFEEDWAVALDW